MLPTQEISFDVRFFPIGDDSVCNCGRDGEAHPIDVPTENDIIFTVGNLQIHKLADNLIT